MTEERELKGPGSYDKFNEISISCQSNYFNIFIIQIISLLIIALLSILPTSSYVKIIRGTELIFIIVVFVCMIWQYHADYMKGWQNARFIAESILSNAWLFVWKCEPFKDDQNAEKEFIDIVENLEKEIDLSSFLSLNSDYGSGISEWMKKFRQENVIKKKENYVHFRVQEQINWYSKKAKKNQRESTKWFWIGLGLMSLGAVLTIGILVDYLPNLSFLGLLTTASAIVVSWSQAKRNDELTVTYGVSAQELSIFNSRMQITTDELELNELVEKVEKAVSREHKLWAAK